MAQGKSICWEDSVKLYWSDFKGNPDSLTTYLGTSALAVTAASIKYKLIQRDTVLLNLKVEFLKSRSWTLDTLSASGLKHEQLHFDIAELYARKIRKKVKELNTLQVSDLPQFTSAVQSLLRERNEMNHIYDRETGHGVVDFMQAEWEERITNELKELSKYASTKEDCKCFNE